MFKVGDTVRTKQEVLNTWNEGLFCREPLQGKVVKVFGDGFIVVYGTFTTELVLLQSEMEVINGNSN